MPGSSVVRKLSDTYITLISQLELGPDSISLPLPLPLLPTLPLNPLVDPS